MQPEAKADRIEFRIAGEEDIDNLLELLTQFFVESDYPNLGLTPDLERARQWLANAIKFGTPQHLVAIDEETGLLVGVLGYCIDHTATVEPFAYLDKFYVRTGWRTRRVGATLLLSALHLARSEGCAAFRAGLSSGIPGGDALFLKNGFTETPNSVLLARRL